MSIEVKNISKLYGEQRALNKVNFSVNPGEIVGLLGPNGAGKSTLMKIISCYIHPTAGMVNVYGYDIFEQSLDIRKILGYLPENNPLYLEMYVKEYLNFIAGVHKLSDKKKRIAEMIELTGLHIEQNKKIGELSKGYRQRVGLAQALIHDPNVLILDEPTSGLDPNQIIEIRDLIKQIGREKTIILSTHIMQEVEAICNRAIIINNGNIVADDATENLPKSISDKIVISVEFDQAVNTKSLRKIKGIINLKNAGNNLWIIETRADKDIRSDIFKYAVNNGYTVLSLNRQNKSLEEAFQQLTKK